jgi:hypothetical protein
MQSQLLQRITKKIAGLGLRKNKANQSQFHAPTQPAKEQKAKK